CTGPRWGPSERRPAHCARDTRLLYWTPFGVLRNGDRRIAHATRGSCTGPRWGSFGTATGALRTRHAALARDPLGPSERRRGASRTRHSALVLTPSGSLRNRQTRGGSRPR